LLSSFIFRCSIGPDLALWKSHTCS
jgi:hypothetical protein